MKKIIVQIPKPEDDRKKSWAKVLTSVNTDISTGYAFCGDFLKRGERVEISMGSFILTYDEPGSVKNWNPHVRLFKVVDGGLKEVYQYQGEIRERKWALGCRDEIAEIVNNEDNEDYLDIIEDFVKYHEVELEQWLRVKSKNITSDQILNFLSNL